MNLDNSSPSPELLTAAAKLAEALVSVEPVASYIRAKAELVSDTGAQALLASFSQAQANLRRLQALGQVTPLDVSTARTLQREMQSNPTILRYVSAQQATMEYLRGVNQEISQLLGADFAALARSSGC